MSNHHHHHHHHQDADRFNLVKVEEIFKTSIIDPDDVDIPKYLEAYEALNKLFPLMGTVFGFVHSDVATKIEQTRDLVESKEGQHYLTFKTMMEFETSNDLVHRKDPRSGSVLLLRLHRALEFIAEFLKEANEASDDASMSSMGRGSYEKTLSKHHGWIVRNTVKLAMLTLPQKKDLFRRITYEDDETMATLRAKGTDIIVSIHSIYERCQALYVKFDLHDIP